MTPPSAALKRHANLADRLSGKSSIRIASDKEAYYPDERIGELMRSYPRTRFVFGFSLLFILVFPAVARNQKMRILPEGNWGGPHIMISVEGKSAAVEYDCAHGTIEGPLTIDGEGKFSFSGRHVRERGGPVRQGQAEDGHPAHYAGWTDGKKMTLTVTLMNTNEEVGTFELTHGQQARLFKCK